MKKLTVALFALVMATFMTVSCLAEIRTDVSVEDDETAPLEYEFDETLKVTLPASWRNKVLLVPSKGANGASFYHKASYDAWKEKKGLEGVGLLFYVGSSVNDDFKDAPSFDYLGFDEKTAMNWFVEYPTDVQAYEFNPKIRDEYMELYEDVPQIVANVEFIDESSEPKPTSESERGKGKNLLPKNSEETKVARGDGFSFRIPATWDFAVTDGVVVAWPKGEPWIPYVKIGKSETDGTAGERTMELQDEFKDDFRDGVVSGPEVLKEEIGIDGEERRLAGVTGRFRSVDDELSYERTTLVENVDGKIYEYEIERVVDPREDSDAERIFRQAVESLKFGDEAETAEENAESVDAWLAGE